MINISPEAITLIMFAGLLLLLATGLPVAFTLGGIGTIILLLLWGPTALNLVAGSAWERMNSFIIIAVPLFVFMAFILQNSGVAEDLFTSLRYWLGGIRGGLAIAVIFVCTVIAAMSGLTATGVVTMGVLALPIMLRLGYNKTIAIGPIMAGGALGNLIPPSVGFIIYGALAEVSIGALFIGGLIPGLILSASYATYCAVACYFRPEWGPALPPEERVSLRVKFRSTKSLILPILLILGCLVPIFAGIASPTEASAIGAIGAVICAAINRKLNWQMFKESCYRTFKITCMIMWVIIGAIVFKQAYIISGSATMIQSTILGFNVPPLVIILLMNVSYMILGCFLDELAALLITLPVYLPILHQLGFSPVWFGVVFMVNWQMATLTPPFGFGLFYMRAVAPPEVNIADIYRSIVPFVGIQLVVLVLVILFPEIAMWLPNLLLG